MDLISRLCDAAAVVDHNGITKSRAKYAELYREAARELGRRDAENARLWLCVRAADRLNSDTMFKWAPEAKRFYDQARAAVSTGDSNGT